MNIEDFKIQVTEEQSKIVQEVLFKNGCKWHYSGKILSHLDSKYLYCSNSGIAHGNNLIVFYESEEPEITFEQFKEKYMKESLNTQVGGTHYQSFAIQPIEFIMKNNLSFPVGNIIKYCCRFDKKNGLEDLKKAKHYLEILIENYDTKE